MELLITLAMLGILLAVALPSYQDSVRMGRRSDAIAALLDVASREEQHMLDRSTYTTDMTALGFDHPGFVESAEGFYRVTAAACLGGMIAYCYQLTAAPPPGSPQHDDACGSFRIDSFGSREVSGPAEGCW